MRNRTAGKIVKTYQTLMDRLKACGIHPKHQILDNEASADYKAAIKSNGLTYELVPPHDHRRNLAEKAIQTFKAHFIAYCAECLQVSQCICGIDYWSQRSDG